MVPSRRVCVHVFSCAEQVVVEGKGVSEHKSDACRTPFRVGPSLQPFLRTLRRMAYSRRRTGDRQTLGRVVGYLLQDTHCACTTGGPCNLSQGRRFLGLTWGPLKPTRPNILKVSPQSSTSTGSASNAAQRSRVESLLKKKRHKKVGSSKRRRSPGNKRRATGDTCVPFPPEERRGWKPCSSSCRYSSLFTCLGSHIRAQRSSLSTPGRDTLTQQLRPGKINVCLFIT